MSRNQRRKFSPKFKAQVALEALQEKETVHQIAEKYELHSNQVTNWKRAFQDQAQEVFKKDDKVSQQKTEKERDQLYKKVGQLQIEIDFLKKSLGEK
jgi:transposase